MLFRKLIWAAVLGLALASAGAASAEDNPIDALFNGLGQIFSGDGGPALYPEQVSRYRQVPGQFRRTIVGYNTLREARHDHHRSALALPLLRARQRPGDPLRHWRRPHRLRLARHRACRPQGAVAGLDAAQGDDRPRGQARPQAAGLHEGRPRQSAWRPCALPLRQGRRHRLSASTAPASRGPSASTSRRAAFAWSTRMSSTSSIAPGSAPRSSFSSAAIP